MCLAGPDPDFLEQLDRLLYAIEPNPVPKCLQRLRYHEPVDEESCSYDDTDDEDNERFRELMREVTVRICVKAGIDIVAFEAERRRRHAREERRVARAAKSNNTKSALHDHAIKPSSSTTEADVAVHQAKNQKRKRKQRKRKTSPAARSRNPATRPALDQSDQLAHRSSRNLHTVLHKHLHP
ncbi:hypothetical protein FACUT_12952 [Fusarium acutatum]|uniref:Uncharacterized protein n=1 Tax=Fusarium acutatum TaxID=78861 RepID=A0A8H4JA78_9HYPO|nr:hypothetical protein FACUT_12952 [Fusarium acutatum]